MQRIKYPFRVFQQYKRFDKLFFITGILINVLSVYDSTLFFSADMIIVHRNLKKKDNSKRKRNKFQVFRNFKRYIGILRYRWNINTSSIGTVLPSVIDTFEIACFCHSARTEWSQSMYTSVKYTHDLFIFGSIQTQGFIE